MLVTMLLVFHTALVLTKLHEQRNSVPVAWMFAWMFSVADYVAIFIHKTVQALIRNDSRGQKVGSLMQVLSQWKRLIAINTLCQSDIAVIF